MVATTKTQLAAQVERLRKSLAREKAKSATLAESRAEALQQQAATAEILKVIASSPADVQPVFDAIVKCALRLIGAHSAALTRVADGTLHLAALTSVSSGADTLLRKGYPAAISRTSPNGKALHTKRPTFVRDVEKLPGTQRAWKETARARGFRSVLVVPMLCDGAAIGTIGVSRKEPGPFSKRQIALLRIFADQAVIAIENVRRFHETKEALEHQKASADILRIISSSPTDLSPVMAALAESAARLCEATDAHIWQRDGGDLQLVASHGPLPIKRPRLRIGRD